MKIMNVGEAKAHFSSVVEHVMAGESICISKRNVPVAQIIPLSGGASRKRHHTRVGWAKESGVVILGDLTEPVLPETEWDMLK